MKKKKLIGFGLIKYLNYRILLLKLGIRIK